MRSDSSFFFFFFEIQYFKDTFALWVVPTGDLKDVGLPTALASLSTGVPKTPDSFHGEPLDRHKFSHSYFPFPDCTL
jgi:hypothetical protein